MEDRTNFLFCGTSQVSKEAKQVLNEAQIEFAWVPAEDRNYEPTLIAHNCAKSFRGIDAVRDYARAHRK